MSTDNVAHLAALRANKKTDQKPPASGGGKPVIEWEGGKVDQIVDAAEQALIDLKDGIYRQGPRMVRVVWDKTKLAGGDEGRILRLSEIGEIHLAERLGVAAQWIKYDERKADYKNIDCPAKVAATLLARNGVWRLPFILGVVTAPTLRFDGSLLDTPGYDESTGILYDPLGVEFPVIDPTPGRSAAVAALDFLNRPLEKFPFKSGDHHSVALSSILTTLVRRSLPTAPLHAFSAPTAGSGKSMLVDIAAIVATGERASVMAAGVSRGDNTEFEKRLTASILCGDQVISIDNMETPLGGELLSQLLTQRIAKLRVLGFSVKQDIPITASFFATGNNLVVDGDMTRRVLLATLNIEDERPELRHFEFSPPAIILKDRPRYVQACLTILRAYAVATDKVSQTPLGSFEEWSFMVRDALLWLGQPDPLNVIDEIRREDPRLDVLQRVISAWQRVFGKAQKTVAEMVKAAVETTRSGEHGDQGDLVNPELRAAVEAIMKGDRAISSEKIAKWLNKNTGRVVGDVRFIKIDDPDSKYRRWQVASVRDLAVPAVKSLTDDEDAPF